MKRKTQLARADKLLRRRGFTARLWQRGSIWIDETYRGSRCFEVTHADNGSIRTDADGLLVAIATLKRGPVESK